MLFCIIGASRFLHEVFAQVQWEKYQDIFFPDEFHHLLRTVSQTICFPSSLSGLHQFLVVVIDSVPLVTSNCALILGSGRRFDSSTMRHPLHNLLDLRLLSDFLPRSAPYAG